MNINYKLIEEERLGDSPFIGALISACNCKFNCENCFNQHIKNLPTQTMEVTELMKQIKKNSFNKGIILSGLEWTLQFEEAVKLAYTAKFNSLQVMLYTGYDFETLKKNYNILPFDYIKCGRFDDKKITANHIEYGVTLASSNQHIYKRGVDY